MSDRVAQTRSKINPLYRADETDVVNMLLSLVPQSAETSMYVRQRAADWITRLRSMPAKRTLLEDFMQRYSLSTPEGLALMAVAECFLRIPDNATADQAIIDKITRAEWDNVGIEGEKLITTLSGWGLHVSESVLGGDGVIGKLAQRMGAPIIRQAVSHAIKLLGGQFVCGQTIDSAIKNAKEWKNKKTLFSYDMLGEGARTADAAAHYFDNYLAAIEAVGKSQRNSVLENGDSISVKISALHPRYEELQKDVCFGPLVERVRTLALAAKDAGIILTLDAEEADRLELSLDIFAAVYNDSALADYHGFGLAVQAYQKRAVAVIDFLTALARQRGRKIPVRLVKGAYWDTEIKRAQERGLSGYPVFTRKQSTDLSYLVAADKMLAAHDVIYPAFATHNAYTVSAIMNMAEKHGHASFEFQRLHGMGENLYDVAMEGMEKRPVVRIYAPVGLHTDLLPYLVRRLLENGANSSFVNQLYDADIAIEKLIDNPIDAVRRMDPKPHPRIALPRDLYGARVNTVAPDLSDRADRAALFDGIARHTDMVRPPDINDIGPIMQRATAAFADWGASAVADRVALLERIADLFEDERDRLLSIVMREGRKTITDAIAEWREAIDFCRYYAQNALHDFGHDLHMPGPTGESNILHVTGRGIFVCISPWNFPLAIFTGQVVAALVAGNCVIAKPAEQTVATAAVAVDIMHRAGVPRDVLQLAVGAGSTVGQALVAHAHTAGVVFTGSTETAWHIQKTLAEKRGPIVPFIAETGGQNAMIVDSTALPEQVVDDVMRSAFYSAGQRCSALRVLYIQHDIADTVLTMLAGAVRELRIGDNMNPITDIGPVIDREAYGALMTHARNLKEKQLFAATAPVAVDDVVAPHIFEITSIHDLTREHFGPLLHVVRFKAQDLDKIVDDINAYGYGLTLGIHSRIDNRIERIIARARVGNIYVNRGMTGAVVGVQPFGGMGLSGTGPKAGGPFYLHRFVTEKTVTINTTAAGGNASLATLETGV